MGLHKKLIENGAQNNMEKGNKEDSDVETSKFSGLEKLSFT